MLKKLQMFKYVIFSYFIASNAYVAEIDSQPMLDAHNQLRLEMELPELIWSEELQKEVTLQVATIKLQACKLSSKELGKNFFWAGALKTTNAQDVLGNWIWQTSLQNIQAQDVVKHWLDEKQWYSYADNNCNAPENKTCKNYIQLVWKNTTEVACAKTICADYSQVWVCHYAPAGNIADEKPY
ncbi:MAG: hypothetical protein KAH84_07200 [Thiomargarita sp.]|nr:hypothetical protein [Thiomargarita sp.]